MPTLGAAASFSPWRFDPYACVVKAAAGTNPGPVRAANEDRWLISDGVFAVADGMGGPGGGDVAAEVAVRTFSTTLRAGGSLKQATAASHNAVLASARGGRGVSGMGTTLTALALGWRDSSAAIAVAHVGDSRAYTARRGGGLQRLTRDQSLVQQLVDEGVITDADARTHRRRNVITSAIGTDRLEPVFAVVPVRSGDRFFLCSDGVHGPLADDDIAAFLTGQGSPRALASALVDGALHRGSRDNVTAVVIEVLTHRSPARAATRYVSTATA